MKVKRDGNVTELYPRGKLHDEDMCGVMPLRMVAAPTEPDPES